VPFSCDGAGVASSSSSLSSRMNPPTVFGFALCSATLGAAEGARLTCCESCAEAVVECAGVSCGGVAF
jgi:hypothetical protein